MPAPCTIYDLHARLLLDTFGGPVPDGDAFLIFALFHHYQVELTGPVLTDEPTLGAGARVHADTQRGCATALAALWAGTGDERAAYTFWYWRWNTDWDGYRHAEHLTPDEKARLRELIARLEQHPFVARLVPEDDGLLDEPTGD